MICIPCPHFNIAIVKRSDGRSAVAASTYLSGTKLFSEYEQRTMDYSHKPGVVHAELLLPVRAPPKYTDRAALWNSVERTEKQWNSQLARRIIMALPRELSLEENRKLVRQYCQKQFVDKGMCCDFAIHDEGDGNPHAHILLTMRALDENGQWLPKARKVYDLDENGERIRLPSGNWKSHKKNTVDWNDQRKAELWRHEWETLQNQFLEVAGRSERVDLRSYERQGVELAPTVHMGPAATNHAALPEGEQVTIVPLARTKSKKLLPEPILRRPDSKKAQQRPEQPKQLAPTAQQPKQSIRNRFREAQQRKLDNQSQINERRSEHEQTSEPELSSG